MRSHGKQSYTIVSRNLLVSIATELVSWNLIGCRATELIIWQPMGNKNSYMSKRTALACLEKIYTCIYLGVVYYFVLNGVIRSVTIL
jgi:hypothetical protein